MIKQTLYPKTGRTPYSSVATITEKIDGSNLCLFKFEERLYVAQRNKIFTAREILEQKQGLYRGLKGWVDSNLDYLEDELHEGSAICSEWVGMGQIGYGGEFGKVVQYAKANVELVDNKFNLYNIYYDHSLFKWSYKSQEVPLDIIKTVPIVLQTATIPTVGFLDRLYDEYRASCGRNVEGFIIVVNNNPVKYVRMKNGKLKEHSV